MDKEIVTILLSASGLAVFIRWVIGDYYKRFSDAIERSARTDAEHEKRFSDLEKKLELNVNNDNNDKEIQNLKIEQLMQLHKTNNQLINTIVENLSKK